MWNSIVRNYNWYTQFLKKKKKIHLFKLQKISSNNLGFLRTVQVFFAVKSQSRASSISRWYSTLVGTQANLPLRVAPMGRGIVCEARRREEKSTSKKKSRPLVRRGLSVSLGRASECVRECVRVRSLSRVRRENSFSDPHETIKSRRREERSNIGSLSFLSSLFFLSPFSLLPHGLFFFFFVFFFLFLSIASLIMRNGTRIPMALRDY